MKAARYAYREEGTRRERLLGRLSWRGKDFYDLGVILQFTTSELLERPSLNASNGVYDINAWFGLG